MTALDINLHPKQGSILRSLATEILFGGAAGGGKSFLLRALAIIWCAMIPGLQVYLFRRILEDLIKNHVEGPSGFRALLAPWVLTGRVQIIDTEIRFWNGSRIYLCHCQLEKHRFKYQGAEIHVLLIDELTTFTDVIYRFLRSRVRMTSIALPPELLGQFPRILAGSNPGNVGHGWVKTAWGLGRDGSHEAMEIWRTPDEEGGMLRQYVPALLEDNPTMAEEDPMYRARLRGLGSPAIVRAFEKGDWDAVAGAFLEGVFDPDRHIVTPFEIPASWKVWKAMDWGFAKPYSVGWWALDHDGVFYRWRELYGYGGKPNEGSREDATAVAKRILTIEEYDERLGYDYRQNIADSAIFSNAGTESIARAFKRSGVAWRESAKGRGSRINGAQRIVDLLMADRLKVFESCRHWIRTVPLLMPDPNRLEDVDTSMEDHAWDETMYATGPIRRAPDADQEKSDDAEDAAYADGHGNIRYKAMT
ncbi:terminase large subunit domain-containing protein [Herbaspirillum chlorophenolicum]|uniref:terminase large subunit domain-containing protein n=1 Tax=Herbaspirillum chlorophenolicum TaxID=211589 RepID=UPI00067BB978|nr:terminase family protein [Herbaspirillum chlorophenolicum]